MPAAYNVMDMMGSDLGGIITRGAGVAPVPLFCQGQVAGGRSRVSSARSV